MFLVIAHDHGVVALPNSYACVDGPAVDALSVLQFTWDDDLEAFTTKATDQEEDTSDLAFDTALALVSDGVFWPHRNGFAWPHFWAVWVTGQGGAGEERLKWPHPLIG